MPDISMKGMIVSKCGSVAKFADIMGWKYSKASRIANGRQEPTATDIKQMTKLFGIQLPDLFCVLFFGDGLHNVDSKGE